MNTFKVEDVIARKDIGAKVILYKVQEVNNNGTIDTLPLYGLLADGNHETYGISNHTPLEGEDPNSYSEFDEKDWLQTAWDKQKSEILALVTKPVTKYRTEGTINTYAILKLFSPLDYAYTKELLNELVKEGRILAVGDNGYPKYKPAKHALQEARIEYCEEEGLFSSLYRVNGHKINVAHLHRENFTKVDTWSTVQNFQRMKRLGESGFAEIRDQCIEAIKTGLRTGDVYIPCPDETIEDDGHKQMLEVSIAIKYPGSGKTHWFVKGYGMKEHFDRSYLVHAAAFMNDEYPLVIPEYSVSVSPVRDERLEAGIRAALGMNPDELLVPKVLNPMHSSTYETYSETELEIDGQTVLIRQLSVGYAYGLKCQEWVDERKQMYGKAG